MVTTILYSAIVFLAFLNFGFMLFDGIRAFVKGDYIRPKTGRYAGQLGPWSGLVKALGIQPISGVMKSIFVVFGLAGISITLCFSFGLNNSGLALLIINILSLWYLWVGTIISLLQIILWLILHNV